MKESVIEEYLRMQVEGKTHGLCLKFVSPGYTGVPDRIVLLPGGRVAFVETKAPKKTERPRQVVVQTLFRALGFRVFGTVRSKDDVDRVVDMLRRMEDGYNADL